MTLLKPVLLALGAVLTASPATAQYFGQWSWSGEAGIGQRYYQNELGNGVRSLYDQRDLKLSLGLNGFIVHPGIAAFRLGIDAEYDQFRDDRTPNQLRLGGRGHVSILPQSNVPVTLYASHQTYDFRNITNEDPLSLSARPDTGSTYGGRMRFQRGLLGGLRLGYDRALMNYVEPGSSPSIDEKAFLEWDRQLGIFFPHLRVERQHHDFGIADYRYTDWLGSADQHANLGREWRWDLSGTGLRRSTDFSGFASTYDSLSIQNAFTRQISGGNGLSLNYAFGYGGSPGAGGDSRSHLASVRYSWKLGPQWTLSPDVGFSYARFGEASASGPVAGLTARWAIQRGEWDTALSAQANYFLLSRSTDSDPVTRRDSTFGYGASASLGHGTAETFRQEVEGSFQRNDLRQAGRPVSDLPDLGSRTNGAATEDRTHGRVTLRKRWDVVTAAAWGEWSRQTSERDSIQIQGYETTQTLATLHLFARWGGLTASTGRTEVTQISKQEVTYLTGGLNVRPSWWLTLQGTYRSDVRKLLNAPDVDGRRAEGSALFRIGEFVLSGSAYWYREVEAGTGSVTTNRGFVWNLTREFGGWLPFISAPIRRGVVR